IGLMFSTMGKFSERGAVSKGGIGLIFSTMGKFSKRGTVSKGGIGLMFSTMGKLSERGAVSKGGIGLISCMGVKGVSSTKGLSFLSTLITSISAFKL
ncbi:hypothetical protein GLOIN_2v1614516, partial [Rhizophagus irregularis DAOM 181602=DAOM 197198]